MSLKRRFMNVARLEALHAAARLRTAANGLFELGRPARAPIDVDLDEEYRRLRAEVEAELRSQGTDSTLDATLDDRPEIRRYYANLELPLGSSADEVKAAYRRLMRRYHPDKHHADPERAAAATRLAHELRQAYEGLLRHLGAHREPR